MNACRYVPGSSSISKGDQKQSLSYISVDKEASSMKLNQISILSNLGDAPAEWIVYTSATASQFGNVGIINQASQIDNG